MTKSKTELVGLLLPSVCTGIIGFLVFVSFASHTISFVISADKLILFAVLFSLVMYVLGLIVSVRGLFATGDKKTALRGVILNIILLSIFLYFSKPFIVEFQFVFLRM